MTAKSTTDYSKFVTLEKNRETKQINIDKIKRSIAFKNLLHKKPIQVTENFEVIDGQHRLEAAKQLGCPIYYVIQELEEEDMIILNQAQTTWTLMDYVNYYKKSNKKSYINLMNIVNQSEFTLPQVMRILGITKRADRIRSGQFNLDEDKVEQYTNILNTISAILDKTDALKGKKLIFLRSTKNLIALKMLISKEDFDLDKYLSRLERHIEKIGPRVDADSCFEMHLSIYNWHNKSPLEKDWSKSIYRDEF